MITESVKSGIQLKSIRLIYSLFEGLNYMVPPNFEDLPINLEVTYDIKDSFINTHVNVQIGNEPKDDKDDNFYLEVEMVGIFEKVGELQLSDDEFAKVNAASIIFPYIRQHIRGLSLDAGLTPIILPLVNFHSWYKKNPQKEDS